MNLPAIKLPKAEPISDQEAVRLCIRDVRELARDCQNMALDYAVRIGRTLIEMRDTCKRTKTKFGDYFPKTDDERDDPNKLPFTWRTGQRLIKIAENKALAISDATHVSHALPADWGSLYQLARIPAPKLTKLIDQKKVTPTMSRTDAAALAKTHAAKEPSKPAKAAKPKAKPKPADRPDMVAVAKRLEAKHTVGELQELVALLNESITARIG